MAIHFSPDIITNGLVFNYDANSVRSYAGPPIQNLADVIVPNGVTDTNIQYTTGSEEVTVPTLGKIPSVPFVDGYNSNSASYCCMQQFYFINGNGFVACSGSTTYTYGILYKVTSGYTHPNFMYRYEYTSGGAYVGEAGVHDDAKRLHLGNGWYWAWNTFTTNSTTARLYLRCFYYQYNVSDRFYVARVLVTPGDYTGLHPRLWPALGTTRSVSQSFKDAVNNNVLTDSAMVYTSNGSFTFNNSSGSRIAQNSPVGLPTTENSTVLVWCKPDSTGPTDQYTGLVSYGSRSVTTPSNSRLLSLYTSGTTMYVSSAFWGNDYTPNNLAVTANQWNMVGMVSRAGTATNNVTLYCGNSNGINSVTGSSSDYTKGLSTTLANFAIGMTDYPGRYFKGNIDKVLIYNRELTAQEIQQIFNADRGRYGV